MKRASLGLVLALALLATAAAVRAALPAQHLLPHDPTVRAFATLVIEKPTSDVEIFERAEKIPVRVMAPTATWMLAVMDHQLKTLLQLQQRLQKTKAAVAKQRVAETIALIRDVLVPAAKLEHQQLILAVQAAQGAPRAARGGRKVPRAMRPRAIPAAAIRRVVAAPLAATPPRERSGRRQPGEGEAAGDAVQYHMNRLIALTLKTIQLGGEAGLAGDEALSGGSANAPEGTGSQGSQGSQGGQPGGSRTTEETPTDPWDPDDNGGRGPEGDDDERVPEASPYG